MMDNLSENDLRYHMSEYKVRKISVNMFLEPLKINAPSFEWEEIHETNER